MHTVKTIKGVEEDAWLEFKSIAARNNINMGKLLGKMVSEYKEKNDNFWDKILNSGKILSNKEAEDMQRLVKRLRKEKGFRD